MASSSRDPMNAVGIAQRVTPITEDQLRRARVAVAANVPHGRVRELLEMLGIADPPEVRVESESEAA